MSETQTPASALFDLIYVDKAGERTMSAGIIVGEQSRLVGPFPAKEAGPQIAAALAAEPALGFADLKAAEAAYMLAHFRNMSRGENDAGQSYPYRC